MIRKWLCGRIGRSRQIIRRKSIRLEMAMKRIVSFYGRSVSLMTMLVLLAAGIFMIPRLWGWEPLIVMSGSMEPTIPTGSVLFTDTGHRDAMEGDIITYYLDRGWDEAKKLVTHRVVRAEQTAEGVYYITKGDSNAQEDFVPVSSNQVTGIYVFHIPKAGWIMSKLDRRLLITAALWLLLLNIFGIVFNSIADAD